MVLSLTMYGIKSGKIVHHVTEYIHTCITRRVVKAIFLGPLWYETFEWWALNQPSLVLPSVKQSCMSVWSNHTVLRKSYRYNESFMMTSSNGNIFRVTGPLWVDSAQNRPVTRSFGVYFICTWTNDWTRNRDAGDLRSHRAHSDVTIMYSFLSFAACILIQNLCYVGLWIYLYNIYTLMHI